MNTCFTLKKNTNYNIFIFESAESLKTGLWLLVDESIWLALRGHIFLNVYYMGKSDNSTDVLWIFWNPDDVEETIT